MDCHGFCTAVPTHSVTAPTHLVIEGVFAAGVLDSSFLALAVMALESSIVVP